MENTQEYNTLQDLVMDYATKKGFYNNGAEADLRELYKNQLEGKTEEEQKSYIKQEATANILGEQLGNQEFINHLVNTNSQTANGLYRWVVDKLNKLNKLTGYKSEKLYWTDVKNKFEKAFNSEFNNLNSDIKYAIKNVADFDEIEYNNQRDIKLSKQNYGILAHAISSDDSIISGVNEVELFDYENDMYVKYTIYYKDNLNWKVIDRQFDDGKDYYGENEAKGSVNRTSKQISKRNEESRSRQTNSQWDNGEIADNRTAERNTEISNLNKGKGSIKEQSNTSINKNSRKNIRELAPTSSFILPKNIDYKDNMNHVSDIFREDYSIVKGFLITIEYINSSERSFFRENSNFSSLKVSVLFSVFKKAPLCSKIEFLLVKSYVLRNNACIFAINTFISNGFGIKSSAPMFIVIIIFILSVAEDIKIIGTLDISLIFLHQ